jgi:hypothetical protein
MKKAALLLLLIALTFSLVAQDEEETGRKGKFFFIPEIWLSFGTRTYIDLAPMVGYHVMNRLALAIGPHYIFQTQNANSYYPVSYQTHSYGLKGFARFSLITNAEEFLPINLFSELFVHVEYEGLSLEKAYYVPPYTEDGRFIYNGFLVGGGISQRIGMHNSISFTILWDINEMTVSPYSNPIFRVGFNAYF